MPGDNTQQLLKHFVEEDAVLRAYVHAATRHAHDTDDLLQNVWQALWEKIDQYDDQRPFRAWAFGVARVEVLRWRQRQARSKELLSAEAMDLLAQSAVEHADELDLRGRFIERCLRELRGFWRRVLELKYYRELSIREIAAQVGKIIPALEMILVRARRALRACVEREMKVQEAAI